MFAETQLNLSKIIAMKTKFLLCLMLVALLVSCRGNVTERQAEATDSVITQAQLLSLERHEGYTLATIRDPWKQGGVLHRYVLVPADKPLPSEMPEGTLVRTPLRSALVYSSVHTSLMRELGMFGSVKGVCDAQFFTDPEVTNAVKAGTIADCGSSMAPTIERVIAMQPDGILLSPYQDATYGQITTLDIPIIECADYMETTPLGRAEWVKFYGELLGQRERADSLYAAVEQAYNTLKNSVAAECRNRSLKVLTENVIQGVWNVPGGNSYMARILIDAGFIYPWADNTSTGSLNLDFNQVLAKAQDAHIWLIKSFNIRTYADLKGSYSLNDQFRAFQEHKVYVCDTNLTRFYERFPFHPDVLLREYHNLSMGRLDQLQFFKPLAQ